MLPGFDGSCSLIEPPELSASSVSGLDNHVSSNEIKISFFLESRDNMEWSFNNKIESLVELTLLRFSFHFVSVYHFELLVDTPMLGMNNDVSAI